MSISQKEMASHPYSATVGELLADRVRLGLPSTFSAMRFRRDWERVREIMNACKEPRAVHKA